MYDDIFIYLFNYINLLYRLCMNILRTYNSLDYKTKKRNIRSWKPIVAKILNTISEFPDDKANILTFIIIIVVV